MVGTLTYCLCLLMNWPVFTYHPAVNRIEWGWGPSRNGEGPAMYWYGWTATTLLVGALVGFLALGVGACFRRRARIALKPQATP